MNPLLVLVTFESSSRLLRIGEWGFQLTVLIEIIVPSSIEVLGEKCFYECRSHSSVTFESGSRLSRIEKDAFFEAGLVEIILPESAEVLGEHYIAD
jgi:hypothetical protein